MRKLSSRTKLVLGILSIPVLAGLTGALLVTGSLVRGDPRNNPVAVGQGVSQVSAYLAMTDANAFDEPLDLQSANDGVSPLGRVWSLKVDGRVTVVVQNAAYDLCLGLVGARFEEAEARFVNSGQAHKAETCIPDLVRRGIPYQANTVVLVLKATT